MSRTTSPQGGVQRPRARSSVTAGKVKAAQTRSGEFSLHHDMIWHKGRHLCSLRNGVLERTLSSANGELLFGKAIAFRVEILEIARNCGVRTIHVRDRDTGHVWRATLDEFEVHGYGFSHPQYGRQRALELSRWTAIGEAEQLTLALAGGGQGDGEA